jgi:hypothetical protein
MTQRTQGVFTLHAIFQIIPSSFRKAGMTISAFLSDQPIMLPLDYQP